MTFLESLLIMMLYISLNWFVLALVDDHFEDNPGFFIAISLFLIPALLGGGFGWAIKGIVQGLSGK